MRCTILWVILKLLSRCSERNFFNFTFPDLKSIKISRDINSCPIIPDVVEWHTSLTLRFVFISNYTFPDTLVKSDPPYVLDYFLLSWWFIAVQITMLMYELLKCHSSKNTINFTSVFKKQTYYHTHTFLTYTSNAHNKQIQWSCLMWNLLCIRMACSVLPLHEPLICDRSSDCGHDFGYCVIWNVLLS